MGTEQQQRTEKPEGTEQQQRTDNPEGNEQQQRSEGPDVAEQRRQAEKPEDAEERQPTEKPEVTDEHKEKAKEIAKAYNDDLQTTTLPGSSGTVSGTAVTDWVDEKDKGNIETTAEEGKVEFRNTDEFKKKQEE